MNILNLLFTADRLNNGFAQYGGIMPQTEVRFCLYTYL